MSNLVDTPGRLEDCAGVLGVALGYWSYRDTSRDKAAARASGTTAIVAIDTMLAELAQARAALLAEIRADDAASLERSAALLARAAGEIGNGVADLSLSRAAS
jgi:hypothetical protein